MNIQSLNFSHCSKNVFCRYFIWSKIQPRFSNCIWWLWLFRSTSSYCLSLSPSLSDFIFGKDVASFLRTAYLLDLSDYFLSNHLSPFRILLGWSLMGFSLNLEGKNISHRWCCALRFLSVTEEGSCCRVVPLSAMLIVIT